MEAQAQAQAQAHAVSVVVEDEEAHPQIPQQSRPGPASTVASQDLSGFSATRTEGSKSVSSGKGLEDEDDRFDGTP